jgi:hypothetical protein
MYLAKALGTPGLILHRHTLPPNGDHMPKAIQVLMTICQYGYGIATALGIPGWTYKFFYDVYNKVPFEQALVLALSGLAATLFLGLWATYAMEWWLSHSKDGETGRRVANALADLKFGGSEEIDAQTIVNIWFDPQPANSISRVATKHGMYHRLREAVRRKWIQSPNFPAHEIRANFLCNLDDSIRFFRNRRWLEISADE